MRAGNGHQNLKCGALALLEVLMLDIKDAFHDIPIASPIRPVVAKKLFDTTLSSFDFTENLAKDVGCIVGCDGKSDILIIIYQIGREFPVCHIPVICARHDASEWSLLKRQ
jgi:hypothetical protein